MATKQIIIGLYSTAPQSGKTTVAQFLNHYCDFYPAHFATPIKQVVEKLLGDMGIEGRTIHILTSSGKEVPIPKAGGKSYRQLCQSLGTEWGRTFVDENIWCDIALRNIPYKRDIVFDDVRFENEYHAIKQRGGQIWKVNRPDAPPSSHASEDQLEHLSFDRVLENKGTVEQLYKEIIMKGITHETSPTS